MKIRYWIEHEPTQSLTNNSLLRKEWDGECEFAEENVVLTEDDLPNSKTHSNTNTQFID